jgi:hypothetical protein
MLDPSRSPTSTEIDARTQQASHKRARRKGSIRSSSVGTPTRMEGFLKPRRRTLSSSRPLNALEPLLHQSPLATRPTSSSRSRRYRRSRMKPQAPSPCAHLPREILHSPRHLQGEYKLECKAPLPHPSHARSIPQSRAAVLFASHHLRAWGQANYEPRPNR